MKKYSLVIVALFLSLLVQAQSNFSFSPQKPRPGDVVTFKYEAPGSVFNASDVINCVVHKGGPYLDMITESIESPFKPVEITLKKKENYYEGTVTTDALTRMLAFTFTSGNVKWKSGTDRTLIMAEGKGDNNNNGGYFIPLYTSDGKPCQFSHFLTGKYLLNGRSSNLWIQNPEKATEYYAKELELYPESKYYVYYNLLRTSPRKDFEKYKAMAEKERDTLFSRGLQTEKDITLMAWLSYLVFSKYQGEYFFNLAAEKYKTSAAFSVKRQTEASKEKDAGKKLAMLNEMKAEYKNMPFERRINGGAPDYYEGRFLWFLVNHKNREALTSSIDSFNFFKGDLHSRNGMDFYHLGQVIGPLKELDPVFAEKFLVDRTNIYADQVAKIQKGIPLAPSPAGEYFTRSEQANEMAKNAAIFSDMTASFYAEKGERKKAWKYITDARKYLTLLNTEFYGTNAINSNYALLSENNIPDKEAKAAIEKLVVNGTWKMEIGDALKRLWIKEKKSENGFDDYLAGLRKQTVEESRKALLATQTNYPAPSFTLKNLEGKEVSLQSLKGKTLILDFWATWCAPCKASFPGMQKMVNYYKNNPDVQFLFVDTWEDRNEKLNTDEKKLQAVVDFINEKKYSFQVLMDNASTVVKDFKVEAIPTKFIVDKNGNVRYKVTGAQADEGKLFDEITTMVESVK